MTDPQLRTRTLAELVEHMVRPFDLIDYLGVLAERSRAVLGLADAGIVLSSPRQTLRPVAASTERRSLLALLELQDRGGPCLDCFTGSTAVEEADLLGAGAQRWPAFARAAAEHGFASTAAFPLRVPDGCIGALNLFGSRPSPLSADDRIIGQAMADLAALAVLHERVRREQHLIAEQLQVALNERILLEQAKGVVAEQAGVDVDVAFSLIRARAVAEGAALTDLVSDIVTRRVRWSPPPGP